MSYDLILKCISQNTVSVNNYYLMF